MATSKELKTFLANYNNVGAPAPEDDLVSQFLSNAEPEKKTGTLQALIASTKKSLGEDITGFGNVVSKIGPMAVKEQMIEPGQAPLTMADVLAGKAPKLKKEYQQTDPNVIQKLGNFTSELTPEQQQAMAENKIASTVGTIAGKLPGVLATSALVPEANLARLGSLAKIGVQGARAAGAQGLYDLATDKGVQPSNLLLAGAFGAGAQGLGELVPKLSKLMPKKVEQIKKGAKALDDLPTEKKISVANVLKGNLSKETYEDVAANPYVQNQIINRGGSIIKETPEILDDAANETRLFYKNLPKVTSKLYKDAGITDTTKIGVDDALFNAKTMLKNFQKDAIGDEILDVKKAANIIKDIERKTKAGKLTFAQVKKMESTLKDLTEKNLSDRGTYTNVAKLYQNIKKELTTAKNSLPALKNAGTKFKNMIETEGFLEDILKVDTTRGDLSLENKLVSKILTSEQARTMLDKLKGLIDDTPGASSAFIDKIKFAQAANDIAKAKAVTPMGLSRLPVLKYLQNIPGLGDPSTKMQVLARNARAGRVSLQPGQMIKRSNLPLLDSVINTARAKASMVNLKAPNIPSFAKPNLNKLMDVIPRAAISSQKKAQVDNNRDPAGKRQPMIDTDQTMLASLGRFVQ